MTTEKYGEDFFTDQRYFHFVVARDLEGLSLADFWKVVGKTLKRDNLLTSKKTEIQHRKLVLKKAYARGTIAESLSENGDGLPPYLYDVIAIRTEIDGATYFAFGFPFLALGAEIIQKNSKNNRFLDSCEILKIELLTFVKKAENHLPIRNSLATQVVGIQFVVTDDKSLTAVRLGGESPLDAQVYVEFLKSKVKSGFFLPDRCSVACVLDQESGAVHQAKPLRSRLHFDKGGHVKFYAHLDFSNFALVPSFIQQLKSLGCLQKSLKNPLLGSVLEE